MNVDQVAEKYGERAMAVLQKLADALAEAGHLVDAPAEMHCDDFRWGFAIHVDGDVEELAEEDIDVTLQICDSEDYDGTDEGIAFRVDAVEVGGSIVGGFAPYNYTDRCWVDPNDEDAVEERFTLIEEADPASFVEMIGDRT